MLNEQECFRIRKTLKGKEKNSLFSGTSEPKRKIRTSSEKPMEKFYRKFIVNQQTQCWEWIDGLNRGGYGRFSYRDIRLLANRASWELHKGIIPEKIYVCHSCDNPKCVNPDHLFLGTALDNNYDCIKKGRDKKQSGPRSRGLGKDHWNSKLDNSDILKIRKMYSTGNFYMHEIAKLFGVTRHNIGDIIRRRLWKHIPDSIIERENTQYITGMEIDLPNV